MPVRAADRHQVTRCMVTGGLDFSCPAGGKILPPPLPAGFSRLLKNGPRYRRETFVPSMVSG